MQLSLAIKTTW